MTPRKICVVSGSRADYGLLRPLLNRLRNDDDLELQLVVTGAHLAPEFGLTRQEIEADGFEFAASVDLELADDSPAGIARSIGIGTIGFGETFERLRPDLLVLLGDRYEILAAAQAAMVACVPIAHIHGGETTQGAIDEAIRHSITKMSHLHFVTAEAHRERVIQLGESPYRVFDVGAPALDAIDQLVFLDRDALQDELDFCLGDSLLLVTYHPVTLSEASPAAPMNALLAALDAFPKSQVILTKANADGRGRLIHDLADAYADRNPGRVHATPSLGQRLYLNAMKFARVVIGNSSSGLIEAPAFGVPTVNIGDRQQGRLRGASVIDCAEEQEAIEEAISVALSESFQRVAATSESPYGNGGAAEQIHQRIRSAELDGILFKTFHDIPLPAGTPR